MLSIGNLANDWKWKVKGRKYGKLIGDWKKIGSAVLNMCGKWKKKSVGQKVSELVGNSDK